MKKKTRDYLSKLEEACKAARELPVCSSANGPAAEFIGELWKARDRFIKDLTRSLPRYEVPETASLLARAQVWPDCEGAFRLPGGQLLVCWVDYTQPMVMAESAYLSYLARRCADLICQDEEIRQESLGFIRKGLGR